MPPGDIGTIHHPPPPSAPLRSRGTLLRQLDAAAAERMTDLFGPDADLPPRLVEIRQLGGALGRRPQRPSAVSHRDAPFSLVLAMVAPPAEQPAVVKLQQSLLEGLRAWDLGVKLPTVLGESESEPGQVRTAYNDADYERLVGIKTHYDPDNLFRINHNIPPEPPTRRRSRETTAVPSVPER